MKCPSTTKSMMFRSRLDWYQQSAMALQTPQRSTWHCGDRQKRKQAVSQFAKYSSLHGVHFICSSDSKTSKVKKILFRVFFAFCMLSTLSNVAFLTQESWFTESVYITTTSKEGWNGPVEDPQFPRHPRITFCRRPAYRIHDDDTEYQELVEYALISLGYPFVSLTPQETALMIGIKAYKMQHPGKSLLPDLNAMQLRLDNMEKRYDKFKSNEDSFNLTQFIVDNSARSDEIFIRCIALVFDLNCSQIFHPVLTSMGTCFSVFVADIAESIDSMDLEITLIFDLLAAPELDKAMDVGYQIYLSDPRNRDGMINSAAETLINGYTTVVKTSLTKTSRTAQFTPWHGLYAQCPRLPPDFDPMNYGDRFFKAACEKRYLEKLMNKSCHCRYVTDLSITSEPQCDPVAVYDCFATVALFDNLTGMAHTCGFPCIEYGYESEVSLVKIGDQNIRLVFVYDGKQYSLREYRKTTLSSFLSEERSHSLSAFETGMTLQFAEYSARVGQIGGALGLYLGASIITVVEMVTFAVTWLWYTCAPSRRKSSPVALHGKGSKKHYVY